MTALANGAGHTSRLSLLTNVDVEELRVLVIYLVSGGRGRTASQVLRACLAQFPETNAELRNCGQIVTAQMAVKVVDQAASEKAVICHTLVSSAVRHALCQAALATGVTCVDLLGPTLAMLGERTASSPLGQAGLLYELHREEFDRMDAVDFTMAHDDGQRLYDLQQAEVVLVGLSRVSKSVTCFYLASRGVRAANVPLIPGTDVPPELIALEPSKVFGLTMNAAHLSMVRQVRLNRIAGNHQVPNYADKRELNREIRSIESMIVKYNWTRLDVSYKATEEVASEIIDRLKCCSQASSASP